MDRKKKEQLIKVLWWKTETLKLTKWVLGLLILVAFLIWTAVAKAPDQYLHVWFLNIGQGDSTYVRIMNDFDLLIDGGPDSKVLSELGEVMPFYDHEINMIIITHPDADHITGLIEVLERYQVNKVLMTDVKNDTGRYEKLLQVISEKNTPVVHPIAGQNIKILEEVNLEIIWPKQLYGDREIENLNDTSIVNKINYKNVSFLFTGDIEETGQKELMKDANEKLKSDVLKVSHHGSYNASDLDFLKLVNPELAIISAGEGNSYGHPHFSTLEKLDNLGIKYLRTNKNGRVEVITDGEYFWSKTEK